MRNAASKIGLLLIPILALALLPDCGGSAASEDPAQVAEPTFSPPSGQYETLQEVAISTSTQGASIRYTLDGSTPTSSHGTIYDNGSPIEVSANTLILSIAYKSGMSDSEVAVALYLIGEHLPAEAPVLSPASGAYTGDIGVTIGSPTPGATISYTTDGSDPATSGTRVSGASPVGPINVAGNGTVVTIRAVAWSATTSLSAEAGGTYSITYPPNPPAIAPAFDPPGDTYSTDQGVTISSSTPNATIRYTTDGSDPATSGTRISGASPVGPISVAGNGTVMTIRAVAVSAATTTSAERSATYYIVYPAVATPTFSPPGGIYATGQSVTISSMTPGATIWYTTDGRDPATSGTRHSGASPVGPVSAAVSPATEIRAYATAPSYARSLEGSATYRNYYAIGDLGPAGGIVFYDKGSYSSGWRYMEAAPGNQSVSMVWWNGVSTLIGTTEAAIGTGAANTTEIVASQGNGNYAAQICDSLSVGVYDDWFLPSKDELNLIYVNLIPRGLGGFIGAEYWSSTEGINNLGAWYQRLNDGTQEIGYKDRNIYVRAVRYF